MLIKQDHLIVCPCVKPVLRTPVENVNETPGYLNVNETPGYLNVLKCLVQKAVQVVQAQLSPPRIRENFFFQFCNCSVSEVFCL